MSAYFAQQITAVASDPISGMYRFTIPIRAMIERGWVRGNVFIGLSNNFDVAPSSPILLQRQIVFPPAVVNTAKQHGCRFIHDLDDHLWSIPPDNPNVLAFTPELLAAMDRQIELADVLTVSTEPLAAVVRQRGWPATVIPNTLDARDWTVQPRRAARSRMRIGWYGQQGVHSGDLALLCEVVRTLAGEVDFIFFGDIPAELADLAARLESYVPVPLQLFPAMLAALDLDILLSPLAHNAFNECKSNLRLLQAGILGYAVIATDVEAHQNLPVARVANTVHAWTNAIRDRLHEPAATRREGEILREAVHRDFLIDKHLERYFTLWTGRSSPVPAIA